MHTNINRVSDPIASDWFAAAAERFAERVAVADHTDPESPRNVTYAELNALTAHRLETLRGRYDFRPGDGIALLDENRLEHIILLLACLRGGFRFVPLNHRLTPDEIRHQLKTARARALLFGDGYRGNAARDFHSRAELEFIERPEDLDEREYAFVNRETAPAAPEDDWIVLFTSGTTGRPRAARLSRRMVLWNGIHTLQGWNLRAGDRGLVHTPLFHAGGLNVLTTPLLFCGGCVHLEKAFHAGRVLELIRANAIDLLFAVPTMFQAMRDEKTFPTTDFSGLKMIISGGAPCPAKLTEAYAEQGAVLRQGFGMTEAGVNCFFIQQEEARGRAGAVGRPMLFSRALLTTSTGEIIEGEGEGRLWLSGPHLFSGYMGVPSADTFDERLGFNTGDIARRDGDGFYYIVGRVKEIIIRGGENIYPAEVEQALVEHPHVAEAVLMGREDDFWGEVPIAFVVPGKPDARFDAAEFYSFCKQRMSSYKAPHGLIVLEQMPRTDSGKPARARLREMLREMPADRILKIK